MVAYEFKRAKRRTIGFVVDADGLVVRAPKWVPLYEVEAALREKATWIVRKLGETRERHERLESLAHRVARRRHHSFSGRASHRGARPAPCFAGVGGELKGGAVLHTDEAAPNLTLDGVPRLTLHLSLPHHATPDQIRDAVQAWLMRQAKRLFTERLDHFAPRLGVQWRKLALSNAGTRWGSAHADGSIRLNWRLIHFRRT